MVKFNSVLEATAPDVGLDKNTPHEGIGGGGEGLEDEPRGAEAAQLSVRVDELRGGEWVSMVARDQEVGMELSEGTQSGACPEEGHVKGHLIW